MEELATAVEAPEVLGAVTLKQLTKVCLLAGQQGRATDFRACWKLDLISESAGSDYKEFIPWYKGKEIRGMIMVLIPPTAANGKRICNGKKARP